MLKGITEQIHHAQARAERAAFDGFLTNPDVPLILRRGALKRVSGIFRLARRLGYAPPTVDINVERSWRAAESNEPGEMRIGAIRRRNPKPVPFFKEDLYDKVFYYLDREPVFVDGRWREHWGDAALYGIASDALRWRMTGDTKAVERAIQARQANLRDIRAAREDPRRLIEHAEGAIMSALGLIITFDILPHWETVPEAFDLISRFTDLMDAAGGYLDVDLPIAFADYYGRTTPTAMFFLINLMAADFLKKHDRSITADRWVADALKFLDAARKKAYDYDGPRFLFSPGDERNFCYPNPLFCLGLAILYRITGQRSALQEAEGIFDWMYNNIRDDKNGGYWTPYTNILRKKEYALNLKSLSAQNYILFACLYLYDATGKQMYLEEIRSLLDFIERDLYHSGILWHDIEDGKRIDLTGPEPYCIGCNLMTLYLLTEINYTFGLGDKLLELSGEKKSEKDARRKRAAAGATPTSKPVRIEEDTDEEDLF